MGLYTVWVVGPEPLSIIQDYNEERDIPAAFPGLTFDYIDGVEEPGPALHFASAPDQELPAALITGGGQIVATPHPGSEPDLSVEVGQAAVRRYLGEYPDAMVTPMRWHS